MFVVVVTFRIKAGAMERFLAAMTTNAGLSLAEEPDCHRFDVCCNTDQPDEVLLYEVYTDRGAFDVHLSSAHFKDFDAHVAPLVAGKDVRTYDLVAS